MYQVLKTSCQFHRGGWVIPHLCVTGRALKGHGEGWDHKRTTDSWSALKVRISNNETASLRRSSALVTWFPLFRPGEFKSSVKTEGAQGPWFWSDFSPLSLTRWSSLGLVHGSGWLSFTAWGNQTDGWSGDRGGRGSDWHNSGQPTLVRSRHLRKS